MAGWNRQDNIELMRNARRVLTHADEVLREAQRAVSRSVEVRDKHHRQLRQLRRSE